MIELDYKDKRFYFEETPTAPAVVNEIFNDNYKIFARGLRFCEEDVVLDIGANEGMFSIMLAKLYPYLRIISFEPVPRTFFQMIRNIGLNGVTNIDANNFGIGKDNRPAVMNVSKQFSGGSSLVDTFNPEYHDLVNVDMISLEEVFRWKQLEKVKLLKMDIEGGEYAALYNSNGCLNKVENMVAEFHINQRLEAQRYDINELATWVGSKTNLLYFDRVKMNE
jgi:FkbM family methyltransferase